MIDITTSQSIQVPNSKIMTASGLSATVFGFDDSHFEEGVDYFKAKATGNSFAYSKWSDGRTYLDPTRNAKRQAAKNAQLLHGFFHFFRFADDPKAQADHFLQTGGAPLQGELPPTLDLEWDNSPESAAQYGDGKAIDDVGAKKALTCLQEIELKSGMLPVWYTHHYFFTGIDPVLVKEFARYPLWLTQPGVKVPALLAGLSHWTFFQNTFHDVVPGCAPGGLDGDVYNGTLDQLQALAKQ